MAQVAFSIRMDEDLKREFSQFCNDIGMSMSTAFVVFAKATLKDRQIPFVIGDRRAPRHTRQDRLGERGMKVWEDFKSRKEALGLPDLTMDEIDAEIAAARKERRERS